MSDCNAKTEISWQERAQAIDQLQRVSLSLTQWDSKFLNSVRELINLTPKQIEVLNGIFHKTTGKPLIDVGVQYPSNWRTPKEKIVSDNPYE